MRRLLLAMTSALACFGLQAQAAAGLDQTRQDLASVCRASSSYDLTVMPHGLLFDRPQPAPYKVELQDGVLVTDGVNVRLSAEQQDRVALLERELRALVPRAKVVAQNGVDLLAQSMREESAGLALSADAQAELNRRLAARVAELKQHIAASTSTHDWQGDMANQYAQQIAGDVGPLLAGDLGQQAISAAVSGDLQAAASLRDRATDLGTQLQPRLARRMQALRPQIQALCPAIQRLDELQQGVRDADGRPLSLLHIGQ